MERRAAGKRIKQVLKMKEALVTYKQGNKTLGKSDGFISKRELKESGFVFGKIKRVTTWVSRRVAKPHGSQGKGGHEKRKKKKQKTKVLEMY